MTRNELIHTIIKYKGNVKICNYQGKMSAIIRHNGETTCLVLEDKDLSCWSHIKKLIDKTHDNECGICLNGDLMKQHIVCANCRNAVCCACLVIGVITNDGIHKCPFCRYESGKDMNTEELCDYLKESENDFSEIPLYTARISEFLRTSSILETKRNQIM